MGEGEVFAMAPCARCGDLFAFDPERVPSIWCDITTGLPHEPEQDLVAAGRVVRRPLCDRECAHAVHAATERGLPITWPTARRAREN